MTHHVLVRLVRQRMKQMELVPYQLHQRLGKSVSKQTVYNFVNHGRVINSDTLVLILRELGLTISKRKKP